MNDFFGFRERANSGVESATEDLAYQAIGAAMEVHSILGPGLPELIYKRAMCRELTLRGIPHTWEHPVPVYYKGELMGEGKMDILVGGALVLELKVVEAFAEIHEAQAISYLKATHLQLCILMNFNVEHMRNGIQRVINTR